LREVKVGSKRLAHLTSGASQLAQSAIPKLLSSTTPGLVAWKQNLNTTLERQAVFFCTKISLCNGLEPVVPQGTFYALVKIDYSILEMDDWEFSTRLLEEENLIVLPGSAIGAPRDVFRISFHLPEKSLYVAAHRLSEFCRRHSRKQRVEEFMNLAML
jgi:aspartate/methionine/tyrosine aminotransferase